MHRAILGLALVGLASGCYRGLPAVSSGQIGCPESDITITDESMGWTASTWTAHCHGRDYYCSSVNTGKNTSQVNCKEAEEEETAKAAPAPAGGGGCQNDSQCKGDRVCRKGECTDP